MRERQTIKTVFACRQETCTCGPARQSGRLRDENDRTSASGGYSSLMSGFSQAASALIAASSSCAHKTQGYKEGGREGSGISEKIMPGQGTWPAAASSVASTGHRVLLGGAKGGASYPSRPQLEGPPEKPAGPKPPHPHPHHLGFGGVVDLGDARDSDARADLGGKEGGGGRLVVGGTRAKRHGPPFDATPPK